MMVDTHRLRKQTEKVGLYFEQSFDGLSGVEVGQEFFDIKGNKWIVGRIDNVVYADGKYHVNGYCVHEAVVEYLEVD